MLNFLYIYMYQICNVNFIFSFFSIDLEETDYLNFLEYALAELNKNEKQIEKVQEYISLLRKLYNTWYLRHIKS